MSLNKCNSPNPVASSETATTTTKMDSSILSTTVQRKVYNPRRSDSLLQLMQGEWVYTNIQGLVMMLIFEGDKEISAFNKDTLIDMNRIDTSYVCILDEESEGYGFYKMFEDCKCEDIHLDNPIYVDTAASCAYWYINVTPEEITFSHPGNAQIVVYKKTKIKKK